MMERRFFFPIDEIPPEKLQLLGGKALNILKLWQIPGIIIPRTGALLTNTLDCFVAGNISMEEITHLFWDYLENNNRTPLFAKLAHVPFPDFLWDEISGFLKGMDRVIVRSSGSSEDSGVTSLAGHYESIISKTTREDMTFTIKSCWIVGLRVFLDHILPFREYHTYEDLSKSALNSIALIIQEVINPEKSGIYFSESPLHPQKEFITANIGTCHSCVDGGMAGDYYVLNKGRVKSQTVRFKFEMTTFSEIGENYLPGEEIETPSGKTAIHFPYGEFLYSARVPGPYDTAPVLNADEIREIHTAASMIEENVKYALDMEWSFSEGKLHILQVRPITAAPPERQIPQPKSGYIIASRGMATGEVKLVHSPQDIHKVNEGDIIAVQATDPAFMPIIYRAGGIISEDGSPLCHTAIVARELKIPCLLGVKNAAWGAFTEGEIVTLDANRGIILREHEDPDTCQEDEIRRNDIVYDMGHLKFHRAEKAPVIALSALLYGYFMDTRWEDPVFESVKEYLEKTMERFNVPAPLIHWDVTDQNNVRKEGDPLLMGLKIRMEEEGMLCRE